MHPNAPEIAGGRVVLLSGPFGSPERTIELERPMAVAEIVAAYDLAFNVPTVAVMDGEPVMRGTWAVKMVRPGESLAFIAVPRGGGNGGGKQIVGLIAAIALSVAAPLVGGFVAGALGFTAGTAAFTIASSVTSIAFLLGGTALLSPLLSQPSPSSSNDTAGSVYSASAASNTAAPLDIIPVLYGRLRYPPRFASRPYAEYSGNDQYLYQLFCLTPGLAKVEKIEIDDTEAWNSTDGYSATFTDLTFEFIEPGDSITLFPANVETSSEVSGQTVPDPPAVLGPFVVNASGTTINRIAVDFAFPAGLGQSDSGGQGIDTLSVKLRAEYQQVDDSGTPIGGWSDVFRETISFGTRTPQRLSRAADVTPARYQVRFSSEQAFNPDSTTKVDACSWVGLRGYLTGFVTPPNCTMLAMKIKANDQLSQFSASQINVTAQRWLPIWDGTSWSAPQSTQSIAWAAADMLRDTSYGISVADTKYDVSALLTLDATWTSRGDTFNAIFDSAQTAKDALTAILRAGRTQAVRMAGRIGFVRLEPKSIKRAVFTPLNVIRGSFQHKLVLFDDTAPDSVNISYFDKTVWDTREVLCTIGAIGSEDPQDVTLFGVDNHDQAWREGITAAAINAYQREFVSFTAEWEGKLLVRGDPVLVMHPFIEGVAQAKVASRTARVITIDRDVDPPEADGYVILRDATGQEWGPCLITSIVGRVITLDATDFGIVEANMGDLDDLLAGDREESAALLLCDGETRPFNGLVVSATPDSSGHVDLLCVIDAPEVYAADHTETMPSPWTTPTLPPATNPLPVIYQLTGALVAAVGGLELTAMWLPAAGATSYVAEASYDLGATWTPVYSGAQNRFTASINPQPPMLRVAGINVAQGPWSTLTFSVLDMPPGGGYIGIHGFDPQLRALQSYVTQSIADLSENLEAVSSTLQDQDMANAVDKRQVLADLSSQVGSVLATVQIVAETLATATAAAAAVATLAQATANGASASGLIKMEVQSTPLGAAVKVIQSLQTDDSGVVVSAMEALQIDEDGLSTKTIIADICLWTNSDGTAAMIWDSRFGNFSVGSAT